jgi:LPS-assembly protein
VRADEYALSDVAYGLGNYTGTVSRVSPEVEARWRYPLIKSFGYDSSLTLEPTVGFAYSPKRTPDEKIPDLDSSLAELSDVNIFSDNRYPGYDQLESGARFNYGVRGDYEISPRRHVTFLLGQAYQNNDETGFPLSDSTSLNFSDIVGETGLTFNQLDLSYRFRLDDQEWVNKRNEVVAHWGGKHLQLDLDYVLLDDEPGISNQDQISGGVSYNFLKHWTISGGARRDIEAGAMREGTVGLQFQNECITIATIGTHDFFHDRDISSGTSFITNVILKNLE